MSTFMSERLHRFPQFAQRQRLDDVRAGGALHMFRRRDRGRFQQRERSCRSKLNAAADAAALAALTPGDAAADRRRGAGGRHRHVQRARRALGSLVAGQTTVTRDNHPSQRQRQRPRRSPSTTPPKTARSSTAFSNRRAWASPGTSTAQASVPPNIDFYLLLDNSPSMSLPATTAGITQMQNLTPLQDSGAAARSPAIRRAPTTATPGQPLLRRQLADVDASGNNIARRRTSKGRRSPRSTTTRWRARTTSPCAWTSCRAASRR